MISAAFRATPYLDGWHFSDMYHQGLGGHGHSSEAYGKTYHRIISMIPKVDRHNTGDRDSEGKIVYYNHKYKVKRVETIEDVYGISPSIANEFLDLGFTFNSAIHCWDLMRWQKDKNGDDVEVKKGLSFSIGDYEARLISGKHAFLFKTKIVRSFKGKR